MDLDENRNAFLEYLKFEKRFSKHTLVAYTNDLNQFIKYLIETYEIELLTEVKHVVVRSWVVSLMEKGISPRSVNRKITTLKTFYKFILVNFIKKDKCELRIDLMASTKGHGRFH